LRHKRYTISLALHLFLLLLITTEADVIKGTVLCSESGLPVDSVRVVFLNRKQPVYTGPDGRFQVSTTLPVVCRPDTTIIDEFDKYTILTTGTAARKQLHYENGTSVVMTLFDLSGRMVSRAGNITESRRFPAVSLPMGVYLLSLTGRAPERLLVLDRTPRGTITKKHMIVSNVFYPFCPVTDTLCFFREGYLRHCLAVDGLNTTLSVTLQKKRWISSDFHNHTVMTDGANILDTVLAHAFGEGALDVFVISEHGGAFSRDSSGLNIVDDPVQGLIAPRVQYGSIYIPRWYTLKQYSWPQLLGQRKRYPEKVLLQGLEWNCPGHEHASVGFIHDDDQPDAVAEFEYRFDFNDRDTSLVGIRKENNYSHENALAAIAWLRDNYPQSSYFIVNHPSREAIGPYKIEHLRDFHNLAPGITLGFEGMPGHQKVSVRGKYGYGGSSRNRTWGGADAILSEVGGIWDALLGEGRRFWVFVNSDYHNYNNDFWPGEYEKTWSTVTDTGAAAWFDGFRRGEVFITHGDLVRELSFSVDDGSMIASMGDDLHTDADSLTVMIRFKSGILNNNGDTVLVDHVDLISGTITGKVDRSDPAQYAMPYNPSTRVIYRFDAKNWSVNKGWYRMSVKIDDKKSMYMRLRGTNLPPGTTGETDEAGNPLVDTDYTNSEQVAWRDLWFYSNPVFVYKR
jgi:hypothetical protein